MIWVLYLEKYEGFGFYFWKNMKDLGFIFGKI